MMKRDNELEGQLDSLSALGDPVRRALYLYILRRGGEGVSRAQAARALHLSRTLAAFHLDRLANAGLLDVSFRRMSGRSGPGAGRPSKLYRKSSRQIDVTFPARRHDLAAQLLAGAMKDAGPAAATALERTAETWGRSMGERIRDRAGAHADRASLLRGALAELQAAGFEPRRSVTGEIQLTNCPFDAPRSDACATFCGMNLAMCRGLAEGLALPGLTPRLEPQPDRCCVVFQTG